MKMSEGRIWIQEIRSIRASLPRVSPQDSTATEMAASSMLLSRKTQSGSPLSTKMKRKASMVFQIDQSTSFIWENISFEIRNQLNLVFDSFFRAAGIFRMPNPKEI